MLVQPFTTKFSNIAEQVFLRCDPKYRHFWDVRRGGILPSKESISLREILSPLPKQVLRKGHLDEDCLLVGIDTSEARDGQLRNLPVVCEIGSDKLLLIDADMIMAKLGSTRGYVFDNTLKGLSLIGSTELIPYQIINNSYLPAFLKYLLLLPVYLSAYGYLESGKTPSHWRLNPLDLLRIKIPKVETKTQSRLLKKLNPLQARINKLKDALSSPVHIINRVFAREFGYSLEEYEKRANQNVYQKSFSDLDKAFLLRSSVKFQHPKYDYLDEILRRHPWVKLKTLCISPIHRGVQPLYSEHGEVYAIKTANLENEIIDLAEAQMVSREFYESKKDLSEIQRGDVLIASTGVGSIGKVDIYELEDLAIADGHVSIVRLDEKKVNPLYMTYYLRSILGYLQIERDLSGATNQIEIYPPQIEQMRIVDLPRKKQHSIVEEIQAELQELQHQKAEIQRLRDQIDEIFMKAVTQ